MYAANAPAINPIKIGTHFFAAFTRSATLKTFNWIKKSRDAATKPPKTGDITQLAAILDIVSQLTRPKPAAAIPDPRTPPTIE